MTAVVEQTSELGEWEPHVRMNPTGAISFLVSSELTQALTHYYLPTEAPNESIETSKEERERDFVFRSEGTILAVISHSGLVVIHRGENPAARDYYQEPQITILADASEPPSYGFAWSFENASDIEPRPSVPPTGHDDVDTRILLWRVRNVDAAIKLARRSISIEIAERLRELRTQPYDRSAGEEPLNFDSLRWFLDYCIRKGSTERPLMTVTSDGIIQGDWCQDKDHRITIRFFPDGMAWIAIRDGSRRGAWQEPSQILLTEKSIARIPDWA